MYFRLHKSFIADGGGGGWILNAPMQQMQLKIKEKVQKTSEAKVVYDARGIQSFAKHLLIFQFSEKLSYLEDDSSQKCNK